MLFKRKKRVGLVKTNPEEGLDSQDTKDADRRDVTKDRRSFGPATDFPFIDAKKKLIQKDRRSRPERRINNIVVVETSINLDDGFLKTGT